MVHVIFAPPGRVSRPRSRRRCRTVHLRPHDAEHALVPAFAVLRDLVPAKMRTRGLGLVHEVVDERDFEELGTVRSAVDAFHYARIVVAERLLLEQVGLQQKRSNNTPSLSQQAWEEEGGGKASNAAPLTWYFARIAGSSQGMHVASSFARPRQTSQHLKFPFLRASCSQTCSR